MANIDTQELLTLCEDANKIAFYDIEATGLTADYSSILVASVKPFGKPPTTFKVSKVGKDKQLIVDLAAEIEKYPIICGYYSKGYDLKMIRSKLLLYDLQDLKTPLHIDMYYTLKAHTLTSRRSQAHYIEWLGTPVKKMSLSAKVWSEVPADTKKHIKTLVERCESDVAGLEELYKRTRHLIKDLRH